MDQTTQDLDVWLEPFLAALGCKKRRSWAPLYLRGLLGQELSSVIARCTNVKPTAMAFLYRAAFC